MSLKGLFPIQIATHCLLLRVVVPSLPEYSWPSGPKDSTSGKKRSGLTQALNRHDEEGGGSPGRRWYGSEDTREMTCLMSFEDTLLLRLVVSLLWHPGQGPWLGPAYLPLRLLHNSVQKSEPWSRPSP